MSDYKAVWKDTTPIKSANKGTPGLEILIELTYKKVGEGPDDWEPIPVRPERRIWLYFPVNGNSEVSIKKLRATGWTGQHLSSVSQMHGKTIEVYSTTQVYEGKERERFDIASGPKEGEFSLDAFRAIDAILQSAPRATTVTPQATAPATGDHYAQHIDAEDNQPSRTDGDLPF